MLLAANENNISIDSVATLPINVSKFQSITDFIVSPNIDEIILGRDWLHENNIIWDFSHTSSRLLTIVSNYGAYQLRAHIASTV